MGSRGEGATSGEIWRLAADSCVYHYNLKSERATNMQCIRTLTKLFQEEIHLQSQYA